LNALDQVAQTVESSLELSDFALELLVFVFETAAPQSNLVGVGQ
jgi:hypothetical protein